MKTIGNFKVIRQNGETFDVGEIGIFVHTFRIDSPTPYSASEPIPGMHGEIPMGTTYTRRHMRADCTMIAYDHYDYELLRNKVFSIFRTDEPFYLIRDAEPGKRWIIHDVGVYTPDRDHTRGRFVIEFISYQTFAESVGTTLDPLTFDSELWQFGQGLILDDMVYKHSASQFKIYNAGDQLINPRNPNMKLLISYKGASNNLKIRNTTTGDEWDYEGTSNSGDIIRLDGVRSTKNGLSIFRDTNYKLITIAPGWNDFILTGTSGSFEITFDFRFYYF